MRAVLNRCMTALDAIELKEPANSDVRSVVARLHTLDLSLFCWNAVAGTELADEARVARCASVMFMSAIAQLADDLADGDCDYLELPHRTGPVVQLILHNLAVETALDGAVAPATLRHALRLYSRMSTCQSMDVRDPQPSEQLCRTYAEGFGGEQYGCYLLLLWAGTRLEPLAVPVGRDLGIAVHIATEIRSNDPRLTSLPDVVQERVASWALSHAAAAEQARVGCIQQALTGVRSSFERRGHGSRGSSGGA
jgi:hypothetical protein